MTRTVTACLVLLFSLSLAGSSSAFTTPGTGVQWTLEDLIANSGGVVTFNEGEERYEASESITVADPDSLLLVLEHDFFVDTADEDDFTVLGGLQITGTDTVGGQWVVLGALDAGGPGGIRVEEGGMLRLEYLVLPGGGADGEVDGVDIVDGSAHLDHCEITDWAGHAVDCFGADLLLEDSYIHANHEYALTINSGSEATVRGCTFEGNNLATPGSGKTNITVGTQGANTALIEDCTISGLPGNRAGGIAVWNFTGTSQHATIRGTTVEDCAYGIVVQSGNATADISDCTLINNTALDNPMQGGSGLALYSPTGVRMTGTTITGNYWGITLPPGTNAPDEVMLGTVDPANEWEEGYNQIYDNGNSSSGTYEEVALFNGTAADIMAQNNYWGTTDPDEVEEVITHQVDDPGTGLVTFEPLWDGIMNQPPEIVDWSPEEAELEVYRFGSISFEVTVEDPNDPAEELTIEWFQESFPGGDPVGTGASISLSFGADNQVSDQVTVVVTDPDGATDTHEWDIDVLDPPWPEFTELIPEETTLEILTGESIEFYAHAEVEGGFEVGYSFMLDGTTVSEENEVTLTFDEEGVFQVSVWAFVMVGGELVGPEHTWTVNVNENDVPDNTTLPGEFSLSTYPNPFNDELRLTVALPTPGEVTLEIYNIQGQRVYQSPPRNVTAGVVPFNWHGGSNASGIYFVKVSAGAEWQTLRKVTLLR